MFVCAERDNCSWHQTTNLVFPNFFHLFFSALAVEKENKLFIVPKQVFFSVLDQWKVCFLFQLLKLRKIHGKNGGKNGCLVVWCHEQDNLVNVFFQMSLEFKPRLLLSALCYSKISTICHFQDSVKKAFKDLKTISSLASSI